jgi:CTP synthase (UTP-ammonia lyase)
MSSVVSIGIIGDYDASRLSHQATNEALRHGAHALKMDMELQWLPTESLESDVGKVAGRFDGFWCSPGTPYKSMKGALSAIQFARENDCPFIGTCGGFQYAVIEYAQNKLGFKDAQHAEYEPGASRLFITPLSCSLVGATRKIIIDRTSTVFEYYNNVEVVERYNCSFGLNPDWRQVIDASGLKVVGVDENGEARILALSQNTFFVATLFLPQQNSLPAKPHPLILAYLNCANSFHLLRRNA